jgi:protein-tyrosine sulfotransferase
MTGLFSKAVVRARRRSRRRREHLLLESGWYESGARSTRDAVFIGGCGRSGTTLFKELLNRHSDCACGPETSLYGLPFQIDNIAVPWGIDRAKLEQMQSTSANLIEFADRFATDFLSQEGKSRWVEKTPNNVRVIDRLLTWYPRSKFIHVIRDGRDVMCSLRNHPRERVIKGRIVPVSTENPPEKSANRWLEDTIRGLAFRDHPRCLEVRYESLVQDPERELRRVCAFINVPYEQSMLEPDQVEPERVGQNMNNAMASSPISSKSVGRWRSNLSESERAVFVNIAGELLITLGYAQDHQWIQDWDD